ncbi:TRAP transporter substrate-binding protein [uncultured Sulfitobacter sp.]|uniref:TRAP transporter substrate-binding protein n=1 Tax=uncultured Sulfitobacter sp. TaxID=191468 RepID=UPI00263873D5|nr:TRAP transporter substrate-binding protein [uncultured Sulfitobacter sp.]
MLLKQLSVFSTKATAGAIALSAALLGTMAAAEPDTILKMGHAGSTTTPGHVAMEQVDAELRARTEGRVGIEIFPSSQLGGERELIESIQLGNVDMAFVSSAPLAAFSASFYVMDMPFLFKDREAVYSVLDGEIGQEMLAELSQVGIMGLGYWENGFRQLTNDKQEVRTLDDLAGLKMRTMENEVHIAAWRAVGANPAPLSFGELFTALQQGTFDAMEGPINLFHSMKFNEVQHYISRTNHIYSPLVLLMNPDAAAQLSSEDLATLKDIIREVTPQQRAMTAEADDLAIAAMPNVKISDLTAEELAAFSSKMGPVYDIVKEKAGADLVDRIVGAVSN